jgi:hypothetical protein
MTTTLFGFDLAKLLPLKDDPEALQAAILSSLKTNNPVMLSSALTVLFRAPGDDEATAGVDAIQLAKQLEDDGKRASQGNVDFLLEMLGMQVVAMSTIVNNFIMRAASCSTVPEQHAYLDIALRAQEQCRAGIETLTEERRKAIRFTQDANGDLTGAVMS